MFQLQDGRNELYQWDINRKVRVSDPTVSEVHFCNKTDDCSLVVKVYADPTDSELYADIPNILLQSDFPIRAYAYVGEGYTKVEKVFKVHSRTKPADYVYTETEVITVQAIEKRMDELEENFTENIGKAVSDYIEEHPVEVDLTGYATEDWVEGKGYLTEHQDISGKADKEHTHSYNDLTDKPTIPSIDGLATEKYVDDAVRNNTEGIATENWVKNQGYISSIPSEYVTENELTAKGYATNSQLSTYVKKSELPTVPTKVSELENDKNYATEKYVDDAIANIDIPEGGGGGTADLSDYYTKEETYSKTEVDGLIPSLDEYATQRWVTTRDSSIKNGIASLVQILAIKHGQEMSSSNSPVIPNASSVSSFASNIKLSGIVKWDGKDNTYMSGTAFDGSINGVFAVDASGTLQKTGSSSLNLNTEYVYVLYSAYFFVFESVDTLLSAIRSNVAPTDYATKEYVDGLFANIATAEGGSY